MYENATFDLPVLLVCAVTVHTWPSLTVVLSCVVTRGALSRSFHISAPFFSMTATLALPLLETISKMATTGLKQQGLLSNAS